MSLMLWGRLFHTAGAYDLKALPLLVIERQEITMLTLSVIERQLTDTL